MHANSEGDDLKVSTREITPKVVLEYVCKCENEGDDLNMRARMITSQRAYMDFPSLGIWA